MQSLKSTRFCACYSWSHHRIICDECQQIFCTVKYLNEHECVECYFESKSVTKQKKWHDHATNTEFDFRPTVGEKNRPDLFIKNSTEKDTKIAGILYLDFETFPQVVETAVRSSNVTLTNTSLLSPLVEEGYIYRRKIQQTLYPLPFSSWTLVRSVQLHPNFQLLWNPRRRWDGSCFSKLEGHFPLPSEWKTRTFFSYGTLWWSLRLSTLVRILPV